jgi:hypothetical protein
VCISIGVGRRLLGARGPWGTRGHVTAHGYARPVLLAPCRARATLWGWLVTRPTGSERQRRRELDPAMSCSSRAAAWSMSPVRATAPPIITHRSTVRAALVSEKAQVVSIDGWIGGPVRAAGRGPVLRRSSCQARAVVLSIPGHGPVADGSAPPPGDPVAHLAPSGPARLINRPSRSPSSAYVRTSGSCRLEHIKFTREVK